jgi:hypothetical protein
MESIDVLPDWFPSPLPYRKTNKKWWWNQNQEFKKKQKNCWSTWTVPFEGNVVQKVELQTQDEDS